MRYSIERDTQMKALMYHKYGTSDVLTFKEIPVPIPKENEVLVKIRATAINSSDWELLRGKPFFARIWGLLKPKYHILGSDIAGQVVSIGKGVSKFRPGDAVFADIFEQWGGFAEYVCVHEDLLLLKPEHITFEEASAIPQAGVVALQGLRYNGEIKPGQQVLINGAGGGAGTFAIQIAKSLGAEVTGVDSARKLDLMRSIGADHVIDYTKEDFTKNKQQYDLIFDIVGRRSIFDFKRILKPKGAYVMAGGSMRRLLQVLFCGPLISKTTSKKMGLLMHKQNKEDIGHMLKLRDARKVVPVIDRCYPLSQGIAAFQYFGEGLVLGKTIITSEA
ncbi:NADPH:quinone reductase-like Zn-dependent oxidoreductase [Aquimarina sp. EL_43]|uniref:NAD(P)-dependent alcohol dehydrogenase n=1 Tax=unclassified Aquimarina TaxID=2627091 RepID=UPI001A224BA1|nr:MULTISPECIES: NAD(P)-dependent alcohol dehydrogenase [unclassified Aquimarina]MBG6129392.1 NADPH:quinone reductase-like Zn-dependent oxidoreductase [Aquimarina sp. EL_35]MBG6150457.1 NADPH:quinone reductase-like Zn-dependent oxidoreductase [Aquimarina sp. EL_32]MBG6168235.1 NADPH:quinone reductase-like Zn-dependent oxidoreductase [Aquimarina sp. EL_43]